MKRSLLGWLAGMSVSGFIAVMFAIDMHDVGANEFNVGGLVVVGLATAGCLIEGIRELYLSWRP